MNRRIKWKRPFISLFLLVLISTVLIAPSAAETLPERVYVNESYTEETPDWGYLNFSHIQAGVNGVAPGGEVLVFGGTYHESLQINKSVYVTNIDHQEPTDPVHVIINAGGAENGVEIDASDVSLQGFRIQNASKTGIYAHNADSISVMDNMIALSQDTDDETSGIFVEEGDDIRIVRNWVMNFGNVVQSGIIVEGVSDTTIEENLIMALSSGSEIVPVGAAGLVSTSCHQEDELSFISIDSAEDVLYTRTDGIYIIESSNVAVLNNSVASISMNIVENSTNADAWGIRSCTSERVHILNNFVGVLAQSTDSASSVGIYGSGDLALIEGNEVTVFAVGQYVQPVGIRLGYSEKGRVLQNQINVEVDCTRTKGHYGLKRPAGILAFDSYKAQIIENDIYYELISTGIPETSRVQVNGISIENCDEARIRENLAIVENTIIRDPTGTIGPSPSDLLLAEEEADPLCVCGIVSGLEIGWSDEPEIIDNVIHAFGTVIAYQELSEEDSYAGVEEEITISGIYLRGGWGEPISNPVISGNSVIAGAHSIALAGMLPYEEELFLDHTLNPGMQERYDALLSNKAENPLYMAEDLIPMIESDLDLSSLRTTNTKLEMQAEQISIAQVRTATAGIVLEDVYNPVISYNSVPVFQDVILLAGGEENLYEESFFQDAPSGIGLVDQLFRSDQAENAFLLNLINENEDEWEKLPQSDKAAIRDAILSGDKDVLAEYAEDTELFGEESKMVEMILEHWAFLQNEEYLEFLNNSHVAAAIPISVSYGLLASAEGDMEIYGNNFTLITDAISISQADSEDFMVNTTAALSAGLISTFGIRGTADTITIEDNSISIENNGLFLTGARGGESEFSDSAAASAHLIVAMGIIADAENTSILSNEIQMKQSNEVMTESLNRIKDRMALSAAGMAGLATGIVLDSDTILDEESSNLLSIKDPYEIEDLIEGNNITIFNAIMTLSAAEEELTPPLDGSSTALSVAACAAASFGIVAPEAVILENTIYVATQQISLTGAFVEEEDTDTVESAGSTHPGAGAAIIGIAVSNGILTGQSYIANNDVLTNAGSFGMIYAMTEELLEDATALITIASVNIGLVSLAPSYIDGNTVNGDNMAGMIAYVGGDRTEIEDTLFVQNLGILSIGGDATFNNIQNGYLGLPYYDGEEIYEPFASHNWWGDPSGPSGIGPGTGSPVMGTTLYEPWLTRPADEVKETGKSYFGLEIGSPFIGGDDYRNGLTPGWNTLSFPLALEDNSWRSITGSGDGLDYMIAYSWNPTNQQWVQVTDTTNIQPLDAIYIRMNSSDRLPVQISPEITGPPVRYLNKGWNLVGPAYDLVDLGEPIGDQYLWWGEPYETSVIKALASIEETPEGKTGYTIVISPSINPNTWVFTRNEIESVPGMDATRGYWVYMENMDQLAGFSTTPLPMPEWLWDL